MNSRSFLPFLTVALVCPAFGADLSPDVQKLHDRLLKSKASTYAGGNGLTCETAIVIKTASHKKAVAHEYAYLKKVYPGYTVNTQALLSDNGRKYDRIQFTTKKGERVTVFFDITAGFSNMDNQPDR